MPIKTKKYERVLKSYIFNYQYVTKIRFHFINIPGHFHLFKKNNAFAEIALLILQMLDNKKVIFLRHVYLYLFKEEM